MKRRKRLNRERKLERLLNEIRDQKRLLIEEAVARATASGIELTDGTPVTEVAVEPKQYAILAQLELDAICQLHPIADKLDLTVDSPLAALPTEKLIEAYDALVAAKQPRLS